MQTTLINLRTKKGQPRPYCDAYIDRRSPFGNPYQIGRDGDRKQVLEKYRAYFKWKIEDPWFRGQVHNLKGKILGCWCTPDECHGDVIIEYLNALPEEIDNPPPKGYYTS